MISFVSVGTKFNYLTINVSMLVVNLIPLRLSFV